MTTTTGHDAPNELDLDWLTSLFEDDPEFDFADAAAAADPSSAGASATGPAKKRKGPAFHG